MNILLLISFTFLSVPAHSRIVYFGSAFSSYQDERGNLFWNPAGMGKRGYLASIYSYSDLIFGSFGTIQKFDDFTLGAGLQFLNSGDMTKTNMMGDSLGKFSYYSFVPVIAGKYRMGRFNLGGKLIFPYSSADDYNSFGAGMDLGIIYELNKSFSFSLYGRNIGRQIDEFVSKRENFPSEFRLGSLYNWENVGFALEYSIPFGFCSSLSFILNRNFEMAIGYNYGLKDLSNDRSLFALSGLSFGIRVRYRDIVIDLGSVLYGPFGISKTIAIGYGS
ncbi:MAG: hypothetical protein U9N06_00540 [candidate division WOR-3 bacterium]|nr:hypothetical protein [candidate division WOR-3 bacterium]